MDGSTRDEVAAAVRSATAALVVVGDAEHRATAAAAALARGRPVVEVWPGTDVGGPWTGLALFLDALRAHAPLVAPPAALEAAATGRPVGDHLGLAADLCSHLDRIGEDRTCTLLVHDVHRLDLSSAAAIGHALRGRPAGVHAVLTQDRSGRGAPGLRLHVAGGAIAEHAADRASEPAHVEDAERRLREAVHLGAVLDAAAAAEALADWVGAASWWLDGGRPDRCARALALAGPSPRAAGVEARLALCTGSDSRRRAATEHAVAQLDACDPLGAVRLRVVDASIRMSQGDIDQAAVLLDHAAAVLGTVEPSPAERTARELHDVVSSALALRRGAGADALLRSVERPLARLGAGGVDADGVRVLAAAAMPLGQHDHLDEARSLLDRVVAVLDARRRFVLLAPPLATSAWLARRRGRLELALTHGSRAIDVARACGWTSDERRATVEVAHVEALRGRVEECRRHAAALVPSDAAPRGRAQLGVISALSVAELLADAPDRALQLLEPVQARFRDSVAPSHTAWRHNLVEAYVRTGRIAEAEDILRELVRCADWTGSARERGQVSWCKGMLAAAGEHDEHFAEARRHLEAYPTLRWRADLHHLRRLLMEDRWSEAAALADRLVDEADRAGLAAAAQHVRRVQRSHGVQVPDVGPPTATALSVEHLRVALALAEGADVEEVAAQLRLTPRRVEAARASVLGMLGIGDAEPLAGFLQLDRSSRTAALVRILGPTAVRRGDQQLVPPLGRPAAVLALVAAEGDVPVDRVLDELWPDVEPDRSRPRLRNVLARLRAGVGPVVERDGERLALAAGVDVDARRFDRLVDAALRAPEHLVLARTEAALAAWGGEPLPAWPYEDWALRERARLVQRCVTVHVRRADALVAGGAIEAALDQLEQAVALQPDARDLWERAVGLADADERIGRARALRRRAADHDIELV